MDETRKSDRARSLSLKAVLNAKQNGHHHVSLIPVCERQAGTSTRKRKRSAEEVASLCKKSRVTDECGPSGNQTGRVLQPPVTCAHLPGRKPQIQLLTTLLSRPFLPPCLYVYGPRSSGKTLTLSTVLTTLKLKCAVVSCRENYCPELLLTEILRQLSGPLGDGFRCPHMHKFLSLFKQLPCVLNRVPVCIVLDNADWLVSNPVFFTALKKLSELVKSCSPSVCVIITSHLVMDKFFDGKETNDLIPLSFPQYSKAETLEILKLDCPPDQPLPLFQTFVSHVWSVFHVLCRDLYELRQLTLILFPKFLEPVERGEVTPKEAHRLWKCMEPHFRTVINNFHLRDMSSLSSAAKCPSSSLPLAELPTSSKYLLIASFLASFNPSKTDSRIFSKSRQAKLHKSRLHAAAEKASQQQLGPKEFSLDRMLAIYCSILCDKVPPTAHLHAQVCSLVSLQLLSQCSKCEVLDMPKYKCLINLALAQQLSKSVGFELVHHLHDFHA